MMSEECPVCGCPIQPNEEDHDKWCPGDVRDGDWFDGIVQDD